MRRPAIVLAALFAAAACRQEMYDQPKYKPLAKSDLFDDHRASRPLVDGTVPRGMLERAAEIQSAMAPPAPGAAPAFPATLPMPLTGELLSRGRERFEIFCSPCHDSTGGGGGMVVRRGYRPPPSLHIERLRDAPVGQLYDVMTRGLGAMPDYAQQIPPEDRWAIAAYVKALQLSQRSGVADVPAEERARLEALGEGPR